MQAGGSTGSEALAAFLMALRPAAAWQAPGLAHAAAKPKLFAHAKPMSAATLPSRYGLPKVARQSLRPRTMTMADTAAFSEEEAREALRDPLEREVATFFKKMSVADWIRFIAVSVETLIKTCVKRTLLLIRDSWRVFKSPWSLPSRLHATMAIFYYLAGIAVAWYEPSQIGGTAWLLSWGLMGFMYQKDEVGFKRKDSPFVPKFRANAFNVCNLAGFAIIRAIWVFSGNMAKLIVTEIGPDAPEALFDILRCTICGAISLWPALFWSTQRMFPGKQGYNWRAKSTSASSSSLTPGRLQPGCRVRITGLKAAVELNGVVATLGKWDSARGRWQVKTPDGKNRAMKPQHLIPEVDGKKADAESEDTEPEFAFR